MPPFANPMPTVDQLLAQQRRPGLASGPAPAAAGATPAKGNLGLLATLARTLNGLPNRAPLPVPAPAPTPMMSAAAPPPAQAATAVPDAQRADAHDNMLRLFRRVHQRVGGTLTRQEVILVNRVGWQFGRQASDAEIEAMADRLSAEFEPGSAGPGPPLMPAAGS